MSEQSTDPMAFVYGLLDPRTLAVHYVGATSQPGARLMGHWVSRAREGEGGNEKEVWLRELYEAGLRPIMELWYEVPEEEAGAVELQVIEILRREGEPLVNSWNHRPYRYRRQPKPPMPPVNILQPWGRLGCQTSASCPDDKEV